MLFLNPHFSPNRYLLNQTFSNGCTIYVLLSGISGKKLHDEIQNIGYVIELPLHEDMAKMHYTMPFHIGNVEI